MTTADRVGVLWRGDRRDQNPEANRLFAPLARAFAGLGLSAVPVVYADDAVDEVRVELLQLAGVLVWVDPIAQGQTRVKLDPLLREVALQGVWVSTHPDVILKMGTKEVLYRTRNLGWGVDTHLYSSIGEFRSRFPRVLVAHGPRVLKQNRGNGGIGVFRVELAPDEGRVRVQHAQRGSPREELGLEEFMRRCEAYFAESGCIVDQPLLARHTEGMVRCYLVQDRVRGFGHQLVTALMDPAAGEAGPPAPQPRTYHGPAKPEFQALKRQFESEWVPQLLQTLELEASSLPALWDADFLLGSRTESGEDSYVLCEINVSAVFPFPDEALVPLAQAVSTCLSKRRRLG